MTHKVLITAPIPGNAESILKEAGCEVTVGLPEGKSLEQVVPDFDAVICLLKDKVTEQVIAASNRTRVYANYAVGFDNLDVAAATNAGVALSNTPDVLTDATAEIAWALLFAVARRVVEGDRMMREGRFHGWEPDMLLGMPIANKTLGIVGAGRIGATMARRAQGFEMPLLYAKRTPSPAMQVLGAHHVELDVLLKESDFVSVHTPLTPETKHMIGRDELSMMKPTSILISTGRGACIDEEALVDALRSGKIAGAGLDVYEKEPAMAPGLAELDNVVLLPHLGSATYDARDAMAELAAQNVIDALQGHVPRTCINPAFEAKKRS